MSQKNNTGTTPPLAWIPVADALPEAFRAVIVCRPDAGGGVRVEQGYKDVGNWWKVYGTRIKNVTHWMPFPPPPEEGTP